MAKVTTSYSNWDFNNLHVQQNLNGGDFVGSHTIILCATGPTLSSMSASSQAGGSGNGTPSRFGTGYETTVSADAAGAGFAIPLGVVSDVNLQQQRQINKIYEIGSKLSYTVSARTSISLGLTRILYHGPNLLRMLYAYYPESRIGGTGNKMFDKNKSTDTAIQELGLDPEFAKTLPQINDVAGIDNIFLNAASDLFSQPIGLVMYIKDNVKSDVAAIFIEDCNLVAHQFGISQNSVVVAEGVQLTADRIRHLKVNVTSVSAAISPTV
ncbi:MAG: hypothetical protein BWY14_01228 [Parcubacteria group bacterium ADurb.Bin192]|nr:MAG: hypothetical protein BWY14_01228 [Parcubacteria group bacterium ADurb.Bin192]